MEDLDYFNTFPERSSQIAYSVNKLQTEVLTEIEDLTPVTSRPVQWHEIPTGHSLYYPYLRNGKLASYSIDLKFTIVMKKRIDENEVVVTDILMYIDWPWDYKYTLLKKKVNEYIELRKFERNVDYVYPVYLIMKILDRSKLHVVDVANIPQIIPYPQKEDYPQSDNETFRRNIVSFETEKNVFKGLVNEGLCFITRLLVKKMLIFEIATIHIMATSVTHIFIPSNDEIREWRLKELGLLNLNVQTQEELDQLYGSAANFFTDKNYPNTVAMLRKIYASREYNYSKTEFAHRNSPTYILREKGKNIMNVVIDYFNTRKIIKYFEQMGFVIIQPENLNADKQWMQMRVIDLFNNCDTKLLDQNHK